MLPSTSATDVDATTTVSETSSTVARKTRQILWHLRVRNVLRKDCTSAGFEVKRAKARAKVSSMRTRIMPAEEVTQIERHFKDVVDSNPELKLLLRRRGEHFKEKCSARKLKGYNGLITWNGPWGKIPYEGLPQEPSPDHDYGAELEEVLQRVRKDKKFVALWDAFDEAMRLLCDELRVAQQTWALELCTKTLRNGREVRVHAHAFLMWHQFQDFDEAALSKMDFMASKAFVKATLSGGHARQRLLSAQNGHFYLLCGKLGSLRASGTVELWTDVVVRPPMILQLFVQEKLSSETARRLFLRAGFSAEQNVKNILFIDEEYRKRDEAALVLKIEQQLREKMRPARTLPIVTSQWLPQYAEVKDRYRFLVLEGDSGCGKSRWSRLQGKPAEIFEVDCAGKQFLDLRGLRRPQHLYCLCDEATPQLVLLNKKLFQAGVSLCKLGDSSTGMYSYSVWPFRLRFIITSNNWMELVGKLKSDPDKEWLRANSVYHYCTGPLYEPA